MTKWGEDRDGQRTLPIRDGEWPVLDEQTIENLTQESFLPGNFLMRLLAGEVWRLRKQLAEAEQMRETLRAAREWVRATHYATLLETTRLATLDVLLRIDAVLKDTDDES